MEPRHQKGMEDVKDKKEKRKRSEFTENKKSSCISKRLKGLDGPTVWHEFTPLAKTHNAINLGQGFPDWPAEDFVKEAAKSALYSDFNQYARPQGHLELVTEIAKEYDHVLITKPESQVVVTNGATEALYSAIMSLINPGDEVVLIEPFFDIYRSQVTMAGGVCKYVSLVPDAAANEMKLCNLREAFSSKTRALILNNPHNPTGKIFSKTELSQIASVLLEFPNVIVLSDEVYSHITYERKVIWSIAALFPSISDRVITISSAGKTFAVTGWKIGWAVSTSEELIRNISLANNSIQFSVCTPLQVAVARMLKQARLPNEEGECYYDRLRLRYKKKRDFLKAVLRSVKLEPLEAQGGIFLYCKLPQYLIDASFCEEETRDDWRFCKWLTREIGVTAIPASAFYSAENCTMGNKYVRFAFCKTDEVLEQASAKLQTLINFQKGYHPDK